MPRARTPVTAHVRAAPDGILLLDKPVGLSSNAALQRVRRLCGGVKAGHGGSLDPLASGMLPICLGGATRLAGELLAGRKAYRFGLQLGARTASGDAEGEIIERCAVPALTRAQIEAALARFLGPQQQLPPMYSALKRDGQPLYRLARRGLSVERTPRALVIDSLRLLEQQPDLPQPGPLQPEPLQPEPPQPEPPQPDVLQLSVLCSKGTYVRVLGEDIARALGTCGHLISLRREYVEPFAAEPMVTLEQLEAAVHEVARDVSAWPLLAPDRAVGHLPPLRLSESAARAISQGRALRPDEPGAPGQLWRLYDAQGRFLGLGCTDGGGELRARRLFPQPTA